MVTARPLGLNAPSCCCPLSCVAPTVLWLRAGALASGASPWLFPHLPDFFQGKHFFLYGEFPGDERRKLSRYVTAFNGSVSGFGGGAWQAAGRKAGWGEGGPGRGAPCRRAQALQSSASAAARPPLGVLSKVRLPATP